jgi:hypothetical protein
VTSCQRNDEDDLPPARFPLRLDDSHDNARHASLSYVVCRRLKFRVAVGDRRGQSHRDGGARLFDSAEFAEFAGKRVVPDRQYRRVMLRHGPDQRPYYLESRQARRVIACDAARGGKLYGRIRECERAHAAARSHRFKVQAPGFAVVAFVALDGSQREQGARRAVAAGVAD